MKLFETKNENSNDIFEGDLKLPAELIYSLYDLSSLPGGENYFLKKYQKSGRKRTLKYFREKAASTSVIKLWDNHTVWYNFSEKLSSHTKKLIHQAMKYWQDKTCLEFEPTLNHPDYVYFTSIGSGCYSTYIGKQGGRQIVNIGFNCAIFKHILHEIGHVIGFWHEHTRPDRDNFVMIHTRRISKTNVLNFVKRKSSEVDYQGIGYDYRSTMHYPTEAFSRRECYGFGCTTLSVYNDKEFQKQGRPTLGQATDLSLRDIQRAKNLYSCPGSGVRAFLIIEIKKGHFSSSLDTYVLIKGVDMNGIQHIYQTSYRQGNQPIWNEFLILGDNVWQFFRLAVWNYRVGNDERITMSQTVPLKPLFYNNMKHCNNQSCTDYVSLSYVLDRNVSRYSMLNIFINSAHNLIDTDPLWHKPDPYIQIIAIASDMSIFRQSTKTVLETTNPKWNEWINYGCRKWNAFIIQILDEDDGIDDIMSESQLIFVQPGDHMHLKHSAFGHGYLNFNYTWTLGRSC